MLNQDGDEALDRAEDGSVDDDWAREAGLQLLLLPYELLLVEGVLGVVL
jgi:hypothetical protein